MNSLPDALAVVTWLIDYFNQALPKVLLYGSEAWQLEEIGIAQTKSKIKMEYGEIYGAEHLTRLLTKLPEIVNAHAVEAYTEAYHSGGEPPPPTDWKELVRTPPLNPFCALDGLEESHQQPAAGLCTGGASGVAGQVSGGDGAPVRVGAVPDTGRATVVK